ncbi:MAG: TIGR03668 family PPOX class F420-dependent oxidoreductase [Chloroflexi bacterium]|nr:TIGR03668 family PPOX class F420-dependent oxidoreductase [Chloroflexota bacterium]
MIGVNVAIFRDNRILLTKREDYEAWCMPGGHVDPAESIAQAAMREVEEETGLKVRLTRLVGIYSRPRWLNGDYHIVLFTAEVVGGTFQMQSGEVVDIGYFDLADLPVPLLIGQRERIVEAATDNGGGTVAVEETIWPFPQETTHMDVYRLRDESGLARDEFYRRYFVPAEVAGNRVEVPGAHQPNSQELQPTLNNVPAREPHQLIGAQRAAYITSQRVAHLATADAEGRPHVVPVCYAFDGHYFYIALDDKAKSVAPTRLKRVRNILVNPHVSLLIDSYYEDWRRLSYLLVSGAAHLEEAGTTHHTQAVTLLREKYPQYRAMKIDQRPLIVIEAVTVHGWTGSSIQEAEGMPPERTELDFASLVKGRHVVRQYKHIQVPRGLVERTIEAAGWAPSPHGIQPWRFVVITRAATKEKLAAAMSADWRLNLEMDGESAEIVDTRLRKSRLRITNTPVLIIPCLYLEDSHHYADPARQEAEVTMAVQSLGAAIQNLLLSAYSLGLDTGWMCAPLFCPEIVQGALALPPTLTPHAMIQLGYAAKDPPRRPHRPVSELIYSYNEGK